MMTGAFLRLPPPPHRNIHTSMFPLGQTDQRATLRSTLPQAPGDRHVSRRVTDARLRDHRWARSPPPATAELSTIHAAANSMQQSSVCATPHDRLRIGPRRGGGILSIAAHARGQLLKKPVGMQLPAGFLCFHDRLLTAP